MLKIHNFEVPFFDLDAYPRVWRNLPGYPGFRVSNWGRLGKPAARFGFLNITTTVISVYV